MPVKIAVIGAGVIGLTSAINLLERGYAVTVFAKNTDIHLASYAALAVWMPYKAYPEERILAWARPSYTKYMELPVSAGLKNIEYTEYHKQKDDLPAWTRIITDFHELAEHELPENYKWGFSANLLKIDPTIFMKFLMDWFIRLGGKLVIEKLNQIAEIPVTFSIIINCSGVYSHYLVPDPESFPIRGQYLLVEKPAGLDKILFGMVDNDNYTLVAPRTHHCYLGGTTQYHNWDETVNDETTQMILTRAHELFPPLKNTKIFSAGVGLRPGRNVVRLEKELLKDNRVVVHNYGHGGSGFTVAWGCADEVVNLVSTL
jgi:D-amino-acid oxidase